MLASSLNALAVSRLRFIIRHELIGQVALFDVPDKAVASSKIQAANQDLIEIAKEAHPSIVKRGGGPRRLWTEAKGVFLIVYLAVDTQEAMGANMVNTMMEALVPKLENLSEGQSLMAILSNLATESLVTATCRLSTRFLSRNKEDAHDFAKKMENGEPVGPGGPLLRSS